MAQLIRSINEFPANLRGGAVAVGNFDGVHRGHAHLIGELVKMAGEQSGPAVVMTFDPPPVAVLVPERPPTLPLSTISVRSQLLGKLGVDAMMAYPTDRALLNLAPVDFFEKVICEVLGARAMVEGPNFRFGKDRAGDTDLLSQLCAREGMEFQVVKPEGDETGKMISSSRIRECLKMGDVENANAMLTEPYRIVGIVAKGQQRGRELGFPTANLEAIRCLIPQHGVYAAHAALEGQDFPVALHIGPNPTFKESKTKVEAHVIGWEGTIYGERLSCTLISRLRDLVTFDSPEALVSQLRHDVDSTQSRFESWKRSKTL
ncbi:MAG: riboflavin biosynthesis protein RibF [Planctomycetota bacterium]